MTDVFFLPIDDYQATDAISQGARNLIERLFEARNPQPASYIPLKVHFGEAGNKTYITSANFTGVIDYLQSRDIRTAYIETNALYNGQRQNRTDHVALSQRHGFTQVPVVIADGEYGDAFTEIEAQGNHFTRFMIAEEIAALDQMIVLSHFKGHIMAGYGGAIKQLAMGCASRGGKLAQHSNARPKIKERKCQACEACLETCPAGAIVLNPKPRIDIAKCIGCAACMAVCPHKAVSISYWASIGKSFREKLAEYALAAQQGKQIFYINFVLNVTRGCDCESHAMKSIAPDIGLLASTDPVAVDTASLDLVQKARGRKIFQRGRHTLQYAARIRLGSTDYRLIRV